MVEAIVWGAVVTALFALVTGFRRLPWRWCALVGLGFGIVFGALRLALIGMDPAQSAVVDPGSLFLVGAFGGGLVKFGFDRGEAERKRRSAAFLAG